MVYCLIIKKTGIRDSIQFRKENTNNNNPDSRVNYPNPIFFLFGDETSSISERNILQSVSGPKDPRPGLRQPQMTSNSKDKELKEISCKSDSDSVR